MEIIAKAPLGFNADTRLGPSRTFKVIGEWLMNGEDVPIAHWVDHQWAVGTSQFTTLQLDDFVVVKFLGSHEIPAIGPFKHVRMSDGSLWGEQVLLARFVAETSRWITVTKVECPGFQFERYVGSAGGD
jgi:hypothetical protein